jgi:1-deoxy-D-xylulose-5-phosphate reductoisomerase
VKRIAILGSTGSIGTSALAVIDAHADRLAVTALAAGRNTARFADQVARFRPGTIAMASPSALAEVMQALDADVASGIRTAGAGRTGLVDVATCPDADLVLCASAGTAALEAVLAAIAAGKTVALANKEILVMAGALVTDAARRHGVTVLPVDSEHNAIHQCLDGRDPTRVRKLILTASGGPFREWPRDRLARVGPGDALRHPTWRMGPKITIDSATLMNKGLEVIEARWLFDMPEDRIDIVIHPQSIVHSLVEFCDGSVLAQLGVTDMRLPIQYAFSYPDRWDTPIRPLDLTGAGRLDFFAPDLDRFPCLRLAYEALQEGGSLPVVLNAANEVAVDAFLAGRLGFMDIARLIEQAMDAYRSERPAAVSTLDAVRDLDAWARRHTADLARGLQLKR